MKVVVVVVVIVVMVLVVIVVVMAVMAVMVVVVVVVVRPTGRMCRLTELAWWGGSQPSWANNLLD